MFNLFTKASEIVFIFIGVGAVVGFFLRILDSKDFVILALIVFNHYYKKDGTADTNNIIDLKNTTV